MPTDPSEVLRRSLLAIPLSAEAAEALSRAGGARWSAGTVIGTGFLISAGHAITAAHVVQRAVRGPGDTDQRSAASALKRLVGTSLKILHIASGLELEATVQAVDPSLDAALLDFKPERLATLPEIEDGGPAMPAWTPLRGIDELPPRYRELMVWGFPVDDLKGVQSWVRLETRLPEQGRLQVSRASADDLPLEEGFSGGPVWDPIGGRLVGMVLEGPPKGSSTSFSYLAPVTGLAQAFPQLVLEPAAEPPEADDETRYKELLIHNYGRIDLKGFGTVREQTIRCPLDLDDLFVRLRGRERRLIGRASEPTLRSPGSGTGNAAPEADRPDAEVPDDGLVALDEAFARLRRTDRSRYIQGLVFLGPPGSGKSVLIQRVAVECARRGSEWLGLSEGLIPVVMRLRHLRRHLRRQGNDASMTDFLIECFQPAQMQAAPAPDARIDRRDEEADRQLAESFGRHILGTQGRRDLLLLIDGLDEVADKRQRAAVLGWIQEQVTRHPGWRFIVTSRNAGYQAGELGEGFLEYQVQDLAEQEAQKFSERLFRVVARHERPGDATAVRQLAEARRQMLWRNLEAQDAGAYNVRDLTRSPLLLTCLCMVQVLDEELPRRRVDLYERCIQILLDSWVKHKGLELPFDGEEARRLLERVAWWMHQEENRLEATVDALSSGLFLELAGSLENPFKVRRFLESIRDTSGLLVGKDQETYVFLHRQFQEYLAACHWARIIGGADIVKRYGAQAWWHEVLRLTLALGDPVPASPDKAGDPVTPAGPRTWSGQQVPPSQAEATFRCFTHALIDSGVWQAHHPHLLAQCLREAARPSFAPHREKLTAWRVSPERRQRALRLLDRLIDVRPELLTPGPDREALVAVLVKVAAGGDSLSRSLALALLSGLSAPGSGGAPDFVQAASPVQRIRHPRTGMELVFVPGGSFRMGSDDGSPDERPIHPVRLSPFWIGRFPVTNAQYARFLQASGHREPEYWTDSRFNGAELPVVGVSWDDAAKFCTWAGVQLPTEAQWEYAARGPSSARYPWGNTPEPTPELANFGGHVGRPTPVGAYPRGASWCGAEDIAGNVWEWCQDWYNAYQTGPGQVVTDPPGPSSGSLRVFRGGSWNLDASGLRASFRNWDRSGVRFDGLGFRVVVPVPARSRGETDAA